MAHFDITADNYEPTIDRLVKWARGAPPYVRRNGRLWYAEAQDTAFAVAGILAITPNQAAGVLAAISPQMDASDNFAHDVVEVIAGKRRRVNELQLRKVNAILRGGDPAAILPRCTSPKTNSFYWNILGNGNYVTIDGRMADLIADRMLGWEAKRGIENACNKDWKKPTRYEMYEDLMIAAANRMRLKGYQLQAILWLEAKRWELSGTTQRGNPRKQGPARTGQTYTSLREACS